ncbi:MAG: PCRF domain-containing protein, partial [Defluviitaleaceae bacterium]|nr:PCRF domain-containing protein [Defluviitaleaceae bacterium]
MFERLDVMEARYEKINDLMSDPEIVTDIKKLTALSKEQRGLAEVVDVYRAYKDIQTQLSDLTEMLEEEDAEIKEMAELELEALKPKLPQLEDQLQILLIPKDPNDEKNVIVEIRGAAGGDEANIFALDLYRMYTKYAELKGWKVELMNADYSEGGGVSQVEFMMSGEAVYSHMKYESGAHRVQRVPATESQGRIHTS